MSETVGAGEHTEQAVTDTLSGATDFTQLGPGPQTLVLRKPEPWRRRQTQALRRARPLARRAFNTLRPPGVAMRARKPWLRLRLITLGWKVLFIGMPWSCRAMAGKGRKVTDFANICQSEISWLRQALICG